MKKLTKAENSNRKTTVNALSHDGSGAVVSVIVPVYNAQDHLDSFMKCMRSQVYHNYEILFVDDASEDHTAEILREMEEKDPKVRHLTQSHAGAGAARNLGLRNARGKYVVFLDADDTFEPTLLEKSVQMAEETGADIVAYGFYRLYADGTRKKAVSVHMDYLPKGTRIFNYADCPGRIMNAVNPTPWNKLYRRSFLEEYQLQFEEISSTNDVTFAAVSVAAARSIAVLDQPLYTYHTAVANSIVTGKETSMGNVMIAVRSAMRQALALPCHEEIDPAISYFAMEICTTSFWRYVRDIRHPSVRSFYEEMHLLFQEERFNDIQLSDITNERLWNRFRTVKKHDYRTFADLWTKRLIVSMTSYPKRIGCVAQVLNTILVQTRPADEIVLYLSSEQFPEREETLPADLSKMIAEGQCTVRWCKDLKSHKKYFYAFQDYPDDLIVTIDDDLLYDVRTLERLYDSYLLYPDAVSAMRTHLMLISGESEILPYEQWMKDSNGLIFKPSMQLLATGVGGVLYPPHRLDSQMLNEEAVVSTCLMADDLWLKAMELVSNIPVVQAWYKTPLRYIPGTQEERLYNDNSTGQNDLQLRQIIDWLDLHYEQGIFLRRLLQPEMGRQILNIKALRDFMDEDYNNSKKLKPDHCRLERFMTVRLDIKNAGGFGQDLCITDAEGFHIKFGAAGWLTDENGHGYTIRAEAGSEDSITAIGQLKTTIRCIGDGSLQLTLRGTNMTDEDGKRVPVRMDILEFMIDDRKVLSRPVCIWHDWPYRYELPVKDGQEVRCTLLFKPHGVGDNISARQLLLLKNNFRFRLKKLSAGLRGRLRKHTA